MTPQTHTGFFAPDLTVTIDEQGIGRPVLLLHGGGGPQTVAPLAAGLADQFDVITPTHPGFALTPRPDWYDGIETSPSPTSSSSSSATCATCS
jgi:pimeloyl-ACP methyl ester carboxylesterase